YSIVLTVTDSDGFTATASAVLSVRPLLWPTASFAASATPVAPGANVTFDASGSSDSDGTIVRYTWDFGDGSIDSGLTTGPAQPGTYLVRLLVTDSAGLRDTKPMNVVVRQNQPPVAVLAITPTRVNPGDPVAFDASSSNDPDGSIASYAWVFGDGTGSTGIRWV